MDHADSESPERESKPYHRVRVLVYSLVWTTLATAAVIRGFPKYQDLQRKAHLKRLAEEGRLVAWNAAIPPPVPNEQNFAMIPSLAPLREYLELSKKERDALQGHRPVMFESLQGFSVASPREFDLASSTAKAPDLASLRDQLVERGCVSSENEPAIAILAALDSYRPLLDEVASGVRRPYSRLPYQYEHGFSVGAPSYLSIRLLVGVFALRARAWRAVGCPDEAANDIATILRLGRALKQETLSIPVMTAQATDRIAVSCIWEGIVRHEWTQSSLDQFRSEITESENVTAFRRAYIFESLIWLRVMDSVLKSESPTWGWPPYSKNDHPARPRTESAFWYRPATDAIIRLALLRLADRTAEFAGVATLKAGAFDRARFDEWQATVSANLKRTPSMALAHYDGRAIEVPLMRTLMVASALRFARLACTLEADHLKQFRYPVVLPSDNPDAIDIISGRQVSYETTPDGQSFQLKSVGWTPSDKNAFKEDALDWLHDWAWASPQMVGRN